MTYKGTDLVSWLVKRISVDSSQLIDQRMLFQDAGRELPTVKKLCIPRIMRNIFPSMKLVRKKGKTYYGGLRYLHTVNLPPREHIEMDALLDSIPGRDAVLLPSFKHVIIGVPTPIWQDNNNIMKLITIYSDHWDLTVRGKKIKLSQFGVSNSFEPTKECLLDIIYIVRQMKLCCGVENDPNRKLMFSTHRLEKLQFDGKTVNIVRPMFCKDVTDWRQEGFDPHCTYCKPSLMWKPETAKTDQMNPQVDIQK